MAANSPDPTRLLSVQSHVVSGYVGNRSATFPLQLLGWDVDVANTVQFSNHTGYGRWGGVRFDADHLQDIFAGLERNGLLRYSRMLTGYMPSAGVVNTVLDLVKKLRSRQCDDHTSDLIYLLDPVMGDMGRGMYVAPEVLPTYQQLLPYSTIITPNQFEAQALTGVEISNLASLKKVIWTLHTQHKVQHVIITSVELPRQDLAAIGAQSLLQDNTVPMMLQVGSSYTVGNDEQSRLSMSEHDLQIWMIEFPEVQGYFSGVGDMFAALTLGRFQPSLSAAPSNGTSGTIPLSPIARASELAIASLQGILKNTCKVIDQLDTSLAAPPTFKDEAQQRVDTMRKRELRVIQSRGDIENPVIQHHAKWINQSA